MEPTAKTLAIFGATGRAGQHLVQQALARGYCVRALARDPGKLALQNERLLVIQGSLSDPARVEQVIACLLYTSPSPRDRTRSRMPSSA